MKNEKSILRVHKDELVEHNNIYYFNNKPFTGVYYQLYPEGNLSLEYETLNGKNHGICNMYKEDGTIFGITNFSDGVLHVEDEEKNDEFFKYLVEEVLSKKFKETIQSTEVPNEKKFIQKWIVKVDHIYFSNDFVIEFFELHSCDWLDEDNWEYGDILDDGTMYNGEVVDYDTLCTIMEERDIEHIDSSEEDLHFLDTLEEGRKKYNELIKNTWSEG